MVGLTFSNLKKRDNFSRFKQRILDSKTFEIVDSKKSFYRTDTVVISQDEDLILAFRRAEEDPIFAHFDLVKLSASYFQKCPDILSQSWILPYFCTLSKMGNRESTYFTHLLLQWNFFKNY